MKILKIKAAPKIVVESLSDDDIKLIKKILSFVRSVIFVYSKVKSFIRRPHGN